MALQRLAALLLAIALLFGCAPGASEGTTPPVSPFEVQASTSSEPESGSEPLKLKTPQTVYIYRYFFDAKNYEKKETTYTDAPTLLPLVNHIAAAAGFDAPLPIISAEQDGNGTIIIDFEKTLLDRREQREIYALLHTLSMTLEQNLSGARVRFRVAGDAEPFGALLTAPLVLAPGAPVDFAAILAGIPYEGRQQSGTIALPIRPPDDTAAEFASFLCLLGPIETDAASPAGLEPWRLTNSCILATKYYLAVPHEGHPSGSYRKELVPISDALLAKNVNEEQFYIADHVRQTAKLLFGDDFMLRLSEEACRPHRYFEAEGVIAPSHRGGGDGLTPIVLSYEALEDGYRVEAVYVYAHEDQGKVWYSVGARSGIPQAQLKDVIYNEAPRREIILKRARDGGLRFVSHRFL